MKRAITLTLLVLLSVGVLVPLTTSWSEAARRRAAQQQQRKVKKYSRAWWRQYYARMRRNRAAAQRRRELITQKTNVNNTNSVKVVPVVDDKTADQPVSGWTGESVQNGEAKFRVSDAQGNQIGSAQLAVVAAALPEPNYEIPAKTRAQLLGGVSVGNFRRAVIDRMIREEGWIVNDYSQEIAGKKVFIVVGQTSKNGVVASRLFYFTEIDNRIYSLSTTAPADYADKLAADAELFIQKMQRGNSTQEVSAATAIQ